MVNESTSRTNFDNNPQAISLDDLKLDIWEEFLSESNLLDR